MLKKVAVVIVSALFIAAAGPAQGSVVSWAMLL